MYPGLVNHVMAHAIDIVCVTADQRTNREAGARSDAVVRTPRAGSGLCRCSPSWLRHDRYEDWVQFGSMRWLYDKVRAAGRVISWATVVAISVTNEGERLVLGVDVGPSEDCAFWTAFQ